MTTNNRLSKLVIVSGLPGAGKSAIASAIAKETGATLLAVDQVEASMWRAGLDHSKTGVAAYEVMTAIAREQLVAGNSVILDSVAGHAATRRLWRSVAAECGAVVSVIECVCSDEALHRARIEGRVRNIPGWYELTWDNVLDSKSRFEPWTEERTVLDSVHDLDRNIATAVAAATHNPLMLD